jgi:hypothetical protein
MLFPDASALRQVVEVALGFFRAAPWTDKDYDTVKKHFEAHSSVVEIWDRLGRKS